MTAATLVAELGDLRRFATPRQLMAYAGLVPERALQRRPARGGAASPRPATPTCAGSWSRRPGTTATRRGSGATLRRRQAGQPAAVVEVAWTAQGRLHRRFRRLLGRGKLKQEAVVAVARELLGFVWAVARRRRRGGAGRGPPPPA